MLRVAVQRMEFGGQAEAFAGDLVSADRDLEKAEDYDVTDLNSQPT